MSVQVQVRLTSTGRKLWVTTDAARGRKNMFFKFGVAEELIHYGLHHLRHDTEEGPFVLPKKLRRLDPKVVLLDLWRRKMLAVDTSTLGPVLKKHHVSDADLNIYWDRVYREGKFSLTPLGDKVLQAIKEFFLASRHGEGFWPLYSLEPEAVTPEWRKVIFDACDHWGFLAEFKLFGNNPHALVTPKPGTYWLRQFPRFEDRLHLLLPSPLDPK